MEDFTNLLDNERHSDLEFLIKKTSIKAHKAIIAARSPVFEKMFEVDMLEKNSNQVKITDIDVRVFREVFIIFFLVYSYFNFFSF